MITLPTGTRIWIIAGVTDMRCSFNGLASNRAGNVATPRDQCHQHLACQPRERVVALERHSLCKLIFTPRPSRCAYNKATTT